MDKKTIKNVVFYLLISLVLIRVGVMPLGAALQEKRSAYESQVMAYVEKEALLEEQGPKGKGALMLDVALYQKDVQITSIQSEVLKMLVKNAEALGLDVASFELPNMVAMDVVTEVPVTLRLRGEPEGIVELLKRTRAKSWSVRDFQVSHVSGKFVYALTVTVFRVEQ